MAIERIRQRIGDGVLQMMFRPFGVELYRARTPKDTDSIANSLAVFLSGAERNVQIITGEVSSPLYNHPRIVETFEHLGQKGVNIEIVHSEDLHQPEKNVRDTLIAHLAKEGKLRTYSSPDKVIHDSWLIDDRDVLDEDPYYPGKESRSFYLFRDASFLAEAVRQRFNELKKSAQLDS